MVCKWFHHSFFLGQFPAYISALSGKNFSISSVRLQKFCATTQFDSDKVHSSFKAPFTLKEGLDKTLEHEFINTKEDEVLFYSE